MTSTGTRGSSSGGSTGAILGTLGRRHDRNDERGHEHRRGDWRRDRRRWLHHGGQLPAGTPDGGPSPYVGDNCTTSQTCCGLVCSFSGGNGTCEPACETAEDCPLPYTTCAAGQCNIILCGTPDGGGLNEPCNLEDAGDGNCVAGEIVSLDGSYLGLCIQSGTAATNAPCDSNALRSAPALLCAPGDVCTYFTSTAMCYQNCNLTAPDAGCPAGTTCQPYWEGGDGFTACF